MLDPRLSGESQFNVLELPVEHALPSSFSQGFHQGGGAAMTARVRDDVTTEPLPRGRGSLDRRAAGRIPASLRAAVRSGIEGDGEPTLMRATITDVSDSGVRLMTRRRVPVGERILIDLECEMPLRVHLGYAADSLVIDGPVHSHLVRIAGTAVRARRIEPRLWEVGVSFNVDTTRLDELQLLRQYVSHLHEQEAWVL